MEFRSSAGESKTGDLSAGKSKSGGKESSGRKVKLIAEVKDSDTGDNSEKGMCTKVIFIFHKIDCIFIDYCPTQLRHFTSNKSLL